LYVDQVGTLAIKVGGDIEAEPWGCFLRNPPLERAARNFARSIRLGYISDELRGVIEPGKLIQKVADVNFITC
jgi:hypothetical protein